MGKHKTKKRGVAIEIRKHQNSNLIDEVIALDAHIHIEQMADDCFWFVIETPTERVNFHFALSKKEITDEEGNTYRPIMLYQAWEKEKGKRNESHWRKNSDLPQTQTSAKLENPKSK